MKHLINRLQFELNCTDEEQAFNFRQHFSATFQKLITEAADDICSKNAGENEWLQIDKLEIDLGRFSPSSFEENFSIIFRDKFERELARKVAAIPFSQREASLYISKAELLKYFLLNGTVPWWAAEQDVDLNEIMLDMINGQPDAITSFLYFNQFKTNLWTRIAFQLNDEVKTKLISLNGNLKAVEELFFKWIVQLNNLIANETSTVLNITQNVMDNIVIKNAAKIFQSNNNIDALLEIFEQFVATIFTGDAVSIEKIIAAHKAELAATNFEIAPAEKENTSGIDIALATAQTVDEESAIEKYVVKHAGIILLSPFLKPFFTNLELLIGNEWKSKEAQYKAVHLLKFLCTGEQKTWEYNLSLEKLICGVNIEEPIPFDMELQDSETNECMQLLESVIEHWKALKNTSVAGLRESFLKRDGILTRKENGWFLQVERKTLDILLDSIPWGYTTVSFPWSDELIFVEW
jgi:hypothetical protein